VLLGENSVTYYCELSLNIHSLKIPLAPFNKGGIFAPPFCKGRPGGILKRNRIYANMYLALRCAIAVWYYKRSIK